MKITLSQPQYIFEMGRRANQEDFLYPQPGHASTESRLFVVCDGMGGHDRGEVASEAVATAMAQWLEEHVKPGVVATPQDMEQAVEHAHQALDALDPEGESSMGTTLTAILLHRGGCIAAHMGDSRIYHISTHRQRILYKSRDHSLVHDLWALGEITREEMKTHPRRNVITKAMQSGNDRRCTATIAQIAHIESGDYFLLCSDGVLEQLDDKELLEWICDKSDDEAKIEKLKELTAFNSDNHTAYLVHINDVIADSDDATLPDDEAAMTDLVDDTTIQADAVDDAQAGEIGNSRPYSPWRWLLCLLVLAIIAVVGAAVKYLFF